jgi:hypothetical protein
MMFEQGQAVLALIGSIKPPFSGLWTHCTPSGRAVCSRIDDHADRDVDE